MPVSKVRSKAHARTKNILHNNIPKSESRGVRSYAVKIVTRKHTHNK